MNAETIKRLLGIKKNVPLTLAEMGKALRVCFYPNTIVTPRLELFEKRLRSLLVNCGAQILEYENALLADGSGRVSEGMVIIVVGEIVNDDLPINHVFSLSQNVIMQVLDRACPADGHQWLQTKLNAIMADFSWYFAHVTIYVESGGVPTVCNWNGAIVPCHDDAALAAALIPKLAAPVVPPRAADFQFDEQVFDPLQAESHDSICDMTDSGSLWEKTGVMMFQTSVSTLRWRNKFYQRLGGICLDHRTGMSYGFLARQLPMPTLQPALTLTEARTQFGSAINGGELFYFNGVQHLCVGADDDRYVLPVPEVQIASTRSGCGKTQLNPSRDIVRYGLKNGCITFKTPCGVNGSADCKPSYDTLVIVAHALANAIIASVLVRQESRSPFFYRLKNHGMALAHWHGFLAETCIPSGYFVHGAQNPGVSCSTPQSAIYAIQGKLQVLKNSHDALSYEGDVHTEPHHGTNMTAQSLSGIAEWLLKRQITLNDSPHNLRPSTIPC